jgi:hypothetical protein
MVFERATTVMIIHKALLILCVLPQLTGCIATEPVAPFERGYLAEKGMQWEPNPRNEKLKGHVYTSKEASSGGAGASGGGCGCN